MASFGLALVAIRLLTTMRPACAQSAAPTFGSIDPCPASVGIKNGDFESGKLAPWTTVPSPASATNQLEAPIIESGGYQSEHALQVKFQPANSIGWYLGQDMGQQCEGAEYAVSFAVNWIGFSLHGEADDHSNFCTIGLAPSYCDEPNASPGYYNASTKAGWVVYNYTCKSRKTAFANLNINVQCIANYTLPAFTMKLDNINVELAKDQSASPTTISSAVPSGSTAASTGTQASSSTSGASSAPPVQTGAAGRTRPMDSFAGMGGFCFLFGPVLYQVLEAGW